MQTNWLKTLLFVLLTAFTFSAHAQITSTFDTNADGWTFLNSATPITPNHSTTGGNPAGFISATYSSNISFSVQNWIAPAKFLGSQLVRSMDMNLRFDMQQSQAGTNSNGNGDVRIESSSIRLVYSLPVKPAVAPGWSSYSLKLDETQGWRLNNTTGALATRTQIIAALTNITAIEIRGTYASNAAYTSGIDNVILEQRTLSPSPTIASFAPTSGEPGMVVTITGTNFDTTPANNAVYFGSIAGTITSASTTQLSVTIPTGAPHGPVTVINKTTGASKRSEKPFNPTFPGGGRIITASFKPRFDILLGTTPGNDLNGLAVADLDGDGWNDLLATESASASVSIFRNLGIGGNLSISSFGSKLSLTGAGNRSGVLTVDLDGDGKLDVVTAYVSSPFEYFATYRNVSTPGNLSFESVELWQAVAGNSSVSAVVDVDGDGRPDLIGQTSTGSVSADFWVAQNISTPGNIEFGASIAYFGGSSLDAGSGVTSGDLDSDGKPDLIVKHQFGSFFSIIKNNSTPGAISLDTPIRFTLGSYGDINISDFNRDGKNDVALKDGSGNNDIRIRINTNSGGALAAADFATEVILDSDLTNFGGMSVADVNGDGKPDIIATDAADVGVFENNYSGGAFDANAYVSAYQLQGFSAATYPFSPFVADLNGDNKPELILGYTNSSPIRISIFENNNVPAPVISVNTVSPLAAPVGATVTITGNNFSTTASQNHVYFGAVKANVLSATATQITASVPAGAAYAPVSVRVGELTSRYRLPFVTTFSPGVTFNSTHFGPPVNFTLTNANYDIEVGDLNRDGKPDLLAEANGGFAFRNTHSSGAISVTSLIPDDTLSVSSFVNPRLEDFDGDGLLDAASVNGLAHRNISTPTEISFQSSIVLGLGASTMDQADFNNDGKMDLTVTTDLSGLGDLVIKENRSIVGSVTTGTFGSFSNNIVFNKPAAGGGIASEDFDGDGFADIATTNPLSDNISVYRNAGVLKISNTQFASRTDLAAGDNPGRIYKGDFDADGKVDLLLYHGTGANTTLLTVFHNTSTLGNISFTRIDLTNPSATTVATIADLDGDGKPEILTTSESGNRFSIFKNVHTSGALTAASFAAPFNTTVTAPRGITTGDLNLDGKPEIILTRTTGLLVVYENLIGTPLPTITNFSPDNGPVGTVVTITGTNFDPTTSNNAVTINGTAATVSASTATSLTVTVPAGATTGPISVTVNGYAATSDKFFCVASSAPSTAGLIASYPFNGNANDASGNNNNGTVNGAALTTDRFGIANSAYLFNGTSSFISVPNSASLQSPTTELTMNAWINLNGYSLVGTSGYGPILTKSNSASSNFMYTFQIGSTPPKIYADVNNFSNFTSGDYSFCLNQWYMVTAVLDVNTSYFYVNGILIGTETFLTNITPDALPMQIGRDVPGLTEVFNGKLDDIRIYNRALSACEVASLYTPGSTSPSISGFTPPSGAVGTAIVINGTNFDPSPTNNVVSFNGTVASVTAATASSITATVPSGATTGKISVTVNNCITVQTTSDFTVTAPLPTITSFTPASGPVGTTVTITGTNFSTTAANNTVAFNGTTSIVTASTATSITTTVPVGATTGKISVTVGTNTATSTNDFTVTASPIITITTQPSDFITCIGQTAAFTTVATGSTNIVYQWQYSSTLAGTYNDIANGGGYSNVATATLTVNTIGNIGAGFYRCKVNGDFATTAFTNITQLSINPIPASPVGPGVSRCGPGSVTLTASGGSAGQYRWYTVATGGLPLAGETNATFATPALTANTDFFVAINDVTCESTRTSVTATINPIPAKPVITASDPLTFCSGQNVTLTAPNGFTYLWSNNATTQQITVSTAGSYTVVISLGSCASVASDPAVVVLTNCTTNQPPVITTTASQSAINGSTTISLIALLSDPDNNLDLSTLRIVSPPRSGATASIGTGGILTVNYQGVTFSGTDELTIEVCDLAGLCVQQRITIEVVGDIVVYNGISPNGDGQNDTWIIEYINLVPDARENEVKIFNRWGDLVWEGTNYDNGSIAFRGLNRNGNELPSGTYFYKIQFASRPLLSGYLALRR
jgi:gliding motility-associated-like protein